MFTRRWIVTVCRWNSSIHSNIVVGWIVYDKIAISILVVHYLTCLPIRVRLVKPRIPCSFTIDPIVVDQSEIRTINTSAKIIVDQVFWSVVREARIEVDAIDDAIWSKPRISSSLLLLILVISFCDGINPILKMASCLLVFQFLFEGTARYKT